MLCIWYVMVSDEIADEARKKQAYVRSQAEIRDQLEVTKAERLHRAFIHSHFIKEALEEADSPAWRVAIQKKNEREQRKALFYQQLLAHRHKVKVGGLLVPSCCCIRSGVSAGVGGEPHGPRCCMVVSLDTGRALVQSSANSEERPG